MKENSFIKKFSPNNYTFLFIFLVSLLVSILGSFDDIFLRLERTQNLFIEFFQMFLLVFFGQLLMWIPISILIRFIDKKISWKNFSKRLIIELLSLLVFTLLLAPIVAILVVMFHPRHPDFLRVLLNSYPPQFTISLTIAFMVEIVSLTESRAILEVLSERLEKENLNSKYDALKNQVNPHFLFNSLNVLSSLVYVDEKKADKFIGEFSKVFRYVLELNKELFVKVSDEIKFLDSYMFLQRIRFDNNISLNTNLDQEALDLLIPPLTLQLLIENAIKHNIISDSKKLDIFIESGNMKLIVKNKFQPRQEDVKSTGVGLNNLREKYNIISDRVPEFYEEDGFFIAEIPLIKSEV